MTFMKLVPGKLYKITQTSYSSIFTFEGGEIVMCVEYMEQHPTNPREDGTRGYMKILQGKKLMEGSVNNNAIIEYFEEF